MEQRRTTSEEEFNPGSSVLYVAFELANSTWKMAFSDGRKVRHVTVIARNLDEVQRAFLKAQGHFAMAEGCSIEAVILYGGFYYIILQISSPMILPY